MRGFWRIYTTTLFNVGDETLLRESKAPTAGAWSKVTGDVLKTGYKC